jgi:hypothetical protein
VSRDASLRALRGALEKAPNGVAVLVGPAGPTRGIVLQALAEELGTRFPAASLRRPTLPPGGLWMEIAARLDLDGGYDAKRRILRLAGELSGQSRGILVVIDGADALPAESLYGLLEVARSELGFYLLLGWPTEGAAHTLPDDLFVVTLEGTAIIPAPAFLASPSTPPPAAPRPAEWDAPRRSETLATPQPARAAAPPVAEPEPAPSASFAPDSPYARELPVRPRVRRSSLQPAGWIASGLVVGLLLGTYLGSGQWRSIGAPNAPLAGPAGERGDVYLPASEPPAAFDPTAAARRAEREAAARQPAAPAPAASATPPAVSSPPPPQPAPDVATAPPPAPAADVAATPPPPASDVAAPPPTAVVPEAPPLEPRDLVPAPEAAREPTPRPADEGAHFTPPRGPIAEGRLTVRSETPVLVEVDGRPLGPTPLAGLALPRGEHRVIAKYADGSVALKTIYLASDDVAVSFR